MVGDAPGVAGAVIPAGASGIRIRGLTPEEDAELRRLHFLTAFGPLAAWMRNRLIELRGRDRRNTVREP